MKIYYYILFIIYRFYTDQMKETQMPKFYTSAVSSVLIWVNLLSVHYFMEYYGLVEPIPNSFFVVSGGLLLGIFNHLLFVRGGKFLECGFNKSARGGVLVIGYIVLTAILAIASANLNRTKLQEQGFDTGASVSDRIEI